MAKTIAGNDDEVRMDGFVAHNNVWNAGAVPNGKSYSQTITVPDTHDPAGTTIKWSFPDGNPSEARWWEAPWDKYPVLSYPTLTAGRDTWEDYATTNKEFPVQVKDVKSLKVDFDYDLGKNPEGHNVAFSLWTKPDPNAVGQNIQDEVMVWVHTGWFGPDGKDTAVFSDGLGTAHIFHEPEENNSVGRNWDYTAVQYDKDIRSGQLDLGGIIDRLEKTGVLKGDDWISGVQLGAEVTNGSSSLTVNNLDVNLTTHGLSNPPPNTWTW